jgi:hypothetical protein
MNKEQILEQHGLDFTISKVPNYDLSLGTPIATGTFALRNDKTGEYLNDVAESYTVTQNSDILGLVLDGMAPFGDQLRVTKAGALKGGRKVYFQLGITGDAHINGDIIERYVTVIDSNDGSTALSVGIGDKTMSCQNQFWRFYKAGEGKFRHSLNMVSKTPMIPSLIQTALEASLKQVELYRKMEAVKVTQTDVHKLVNTILGYDKQITSASELAGKSTRAINIMEAVYANISHQTAEKGLNLWGLHSGITRYTTHEQAAPKRENGRIESGLSGTAYSWNNTSLMFAAERV